MNKPLRIYLDSSDFSNLSNSSKKTDEMMEVEKRLLAWQKDGSIEIVFSHLHIVEAAPVTEKDIQFSRQRLLKIKEMCGSKCLRSIDYITKSEGACLLARKGGSCSFINYEGFWFPEVETLNFPAPEKVVNEYIDELPNRESRRSARKKLLKKGSIRNRSKADMAERSGDYKRSISEQFPFSDKTINSIVRHFCGYREGEDFYSDVKRELLDISNICNFFEKNFHAAQKISSWFREGGADNFGKSKKISDIVRFLSGSLDSWEQVCQRLCKSAPGNRGVMV